jgi:predicted GNAT superfamily acetyltransferase
MTNTAPTTLSAIKAAQANPLLSMNNYTSLVISWNDKNKHLTLLSQCKLALIARNTLFAK